MRFYGKPRESEVMKSNEFSQWSNRRPAWPNLSEIKPRPFLEISAQDQLRTKIAKKNLDITKPVMDLLNTQLEKIDF